MNKNTKLLPQLNQIFLQRQSYASHKNKINHIRNKISIYPSQYQTSKFSFSQSRITTQSKRTETNKSISNLDPTKQAPSVILQKSYSSLPKSSIHLSPSKRYKQNQIARQNKIYENKINKSSSLLNRNNMGKEYEKINQIKKRLMKYQVNPQSQKTQLKSEKSLDIISSRVTEASRKQTNCTSMSQKTNKEKAYFLRSSLQRKQTNFSAFVKRTYQIKPQSIAGVNNSIEKRSKQINYNKISQNFQKYAKKIKTEISNSVNIKLPSTRVNSRIKNSQRYFALTEIDM